jgi:CheY-like chemotaxis protein
MSKTRPNIQYVGILEKLCKLEDNIANKFSFLINIPINEHKFLQETRKLFEEDNKPYEIVFTPANKDISILIDEDVPINQEVLKRYLNKLGYKNITIVEDGEECINNLNNNQYDICFIDIKTPKKDGFAVINHIKTIQYNTIPVALTARVTTKEEYILKGFHEVLFKPFEINDLKKLLQKLSLL